MSFIILNMPRSCEGDEFWTTDVINPHIVVLTNNEPAMSFPLKEKPDMRSYEQFPPFSFTPRAQDTQKDLEPPRFAKPGMYSFGLATDFSNKRLK